MNTSSSSIWLYRFILARMYEVICRTGALTYGERKKSKSEKTSEFRSNYSVSSLLRPLQTRAGPELG